MNYVSMDYIIVRLSEEFNNRATIDPEPYNGCEQVLTTHLVVASTGSPIN
jgi:hypothetical protein